MRKILAGALISLLTCHCLSQGLVTTTHSESGESSPYYWNSTPVGKGGQLLTLFCKACNVLNGVKRDVPLVSLLRDTLGDQDSENDRVTYIWLLTGSRPGLGRRILSAIPFFYWRVGGGAGSVSAHEMAPLMDLTVPQNPMMAQVARDLIQWTAFDPLSTPVRASTRAYLSNTQDDERLRLEEAISFLRRAPASNDDAGLSQAQLDTVIARLQLRKGLLGGLTDEKQVMRVGTESGFDQERIRSRNWELLRQWAEKTGLTFEPMDPAGTQAHLAILWFPQGGSGEPGNGSFNSVWKLLGIRDPWTDERLENWKGPTREVGSMRMIPLAVYSLEYPKVPLVLIDFRGEFNARRHEVTQRSINELTAGVLGFSHFANWYFYVASDLYAFVSERHGKAVDEASRLDCLSDFRMALALDTNFNPTLKEEMEHRLRLLEVNPLETAPKREVQDSITRYRLLETQAGDNGRLVAQVDRERRFELSSFGESEKAKLARSMLHVATFGLYKQQAQRDNIFLVDAERRVNYELGFLDSLVRAKTPPEVAYDDRRIESSIDELSSLMPAISLPEMRSRAEADLEGVKTLSQDAELRTDCSNALALMRKNDTPRNAKPTEVADVFRGAAAAMPSSDGGQVK